MSPQAKGRSHDRPVVAVVADCRAFDDYRWHAVPEPYLAALAGVAGAAPMIVPAFGAEIAPEAWLDRVDGVLLSGSRSNVHPSNYGGAPTEAHEPYDEARDVTSLPLIRAALDKGLPLFAICRGMQELNVALGGTVAAEVQSLPGRQDHRAPEGVSLDERFAIRQTVDIRPGTELAAILGAGALRVNTVHRQAIDRLAQRLVIEATAEDGTIEGVRVRDARAFALGVQWHPEYWAETDGPSHRLFAAFGAALRDPERSRTIAAE